MRRCYLDVETTGLDPQRDEVLEIGLLDDDGTVLLDTLVRPRHRRQWLGAQAIHGIRPADVAHAPTLPELRPQLIALLEGAEVILYNAAFDGAFLPTELARAAAVRCAMLAFADVYGDWNASHGSYRWHKLSLAATHIGYEWPGSAHRAIHDCQATRAVWHWLQHQRHPPGRNSGSAPALAQHPATE